MIASISARAVSISVRVFARAIALCPIAAERFDNIAEYDFPTESRPTVFWSTLARPTSGGHRRTKGICAQSGGTETWPSFHEGKSSRFSSTATRSVGTANRVPRVLSRGINAARSSDPTTNSNSETELPSANTGRS